MQRLWATIVVAGCSWSTATVPDRIPPTGRVACVEAGPYVDTLGMMGSYGGALYLWQGPTTARSPAGGLVILAGIATGLVLGTAFLASSIDGWTTNHECHQMQNLTPEQIATEIADEAERMVVAGDCRGGITWADQIHHVAGASETIYIAFLERTAVAACRASAQADAAAKAERAARERAQRAQRIADDEQKSRTADAQELTRQARTAARVGDCATALALGEQVAVLDAKIHEVWFVTDPAIASCITAAGAAPPRP
jgi:hypothetical protein